MVTARMTATTWIAVATSHAARSRSAGTRPKSNSGEHLSEPLRRLEEPRRGHRERDAEEALRAGAERASRQHHDAHVLERARLERGGGESFGQRYPDVHRRARRVGLKALRAQRGERRVAARLEL